MGLIKSFTSSLSSGFGDQFKEFVECPQIENDVIIQRGIVKHGEGNKNYTEGVISNGSTIAVPEGMAMMIIDNGKIVEFSAEPGTYKWDSSSEPSVFEGGFFKGIGETIKTIGNRFTYGGQPAKDQRVYYVNTKMIPGNTFGSSQPETIFDPVYGSVEITYNGEYTIRVADPVILVNNVLGSNPKDTLTYDDIFKTDGQNILKSKFAQKVSEAISNIMTMHNISFNRIQSYKSDVTNQMNQILDDEWMQKYGIKVEDVALRINASEEARKIIQEADAEISKTTRMGQVYSNNMSGTMAAASAEAMKNAANNPNGSMMGFMGMGFAQQQGTNMMGAVAGMPQQPTMPQDQNSSTPMPGTIFGTPQESTEQAPIQKETAVQTETIVEASKQSSPEVESISNEEVKKFCTNCGTPAVGLFCGNCGQKIQ